MRLESITHFDISLKTVSGKRFRGIVMEAAVVRDRGAVDDYVVRVSKNSVLRAGDVIEYDGQKYLAGVGATEMSGAILFRFLKMIRVTDYLAWTRIQTATDTVSGLQRTSGEQTLATIYLSVVPEGKIEDVFRVPSSKYRLIAGSAIQANDRIGDFIVTFVKPLYGLYFCEAR